MSLQAVTALRVACMRLLCALFSIDEFKAAIDSTTSASGSSAPVNGSEAASGTIPSPQDVQVWES